MWKDRHFYLVLLTGLSFGLLGVALAALGNPENSGICISCFFENTAGSLGLHDNERMQYLRPELAGFVLGAMASALAFREFCSRGGSVPMTRFFAGFFLIVGCAVFIGCPIKLFLRMTAGDLTTFAGLAGLVGGVWAGLCSLAKGVQPGVSQSARGGSGWWVPLFFALLMIWVFLPPGFLRESQSGGGAEHAPVWISLGAGLLLGALAQRSRFCITGSLRDTFLMGHRSPLIYGLALFVLGAVAGNLIFGRFEPGFYGQPGAHLDFLWSFFGMALVGWVSVIFGGCPFRQLVKAGEGDADAGMVVLGMLVAGGLVETWGITATAAGVPLPGKMAVLAGFAFVFMTSLLLRERAV